MRRDFRNYSDCITNRTNCIYNLISTNDESDKNNIVDDIEDGDDGEEEEDSYNLLIPRAAIGELITTPIQAATTKRSSLKRRFNRNFLNKSKRYTSWLIFGSTFMGFLFLLYIPLFNNVRSRAVSIPGWNRNTTRDTAYYVLPHINTTIIDQTNVCSDKLFLLVVVCSSTTNFETRQSIRETWGNLTEFNYSFFAKVHSKFTGKYLNINYKDWQNYTLSNVKNASTLVSAPLLSSPLSTNNTNNNNNNNRKSSQNENFAVKIIFLLGETQNNETQMKIINENDSYGDIIQESFIDSYNNLTLKTIMMLKWINRNCLNKVKFLMKCDDDTFVNVPNLLHVLLGGTIPVYNATIQEYDQITVKTTSTYNRLNQKFKLLLGSRFCKSKPIANVSSKWYTPIYMYSGNTYPNYLSGTGYVMSIDVAIKLYNASINTPLFHLEDVYLTGICAEAIKIKPRNHQLFSYTSYKQPCELKGMITKHELTATDMKIAYDFVSNTSINCSKPPNYFRVRKIKTFIRNCN